MATYTNKEERGQYGKLLTGLLKKKYPFILGVDVYILKDYGSFFEIDLFLIVSKDFILENIELNGTKARSSELLQWRIEVNEIPTYLFNDHSKGLKFNTDEFLKLCRMLFMSMFGEVSDKNNYSVQFKVV